MSYLLVKSHEFMSNPVHCMYRRGNHRSIRGRINHLQWIWMITTFNLQIKLRWEVITSLCQNMFMSCPSVENLLVYIGGETIDWSGTYKSFAMNMDGNCLEFMGEELILYFCLCDVGSSSVCNSNISHINCIMEKMRKVCKLVSSWERILFCIKSENKTKQNTKQ